MSGKEGGTRDLGGPDPARCWRRRRQAVRQPNTQLYGS